MSDALHLIIPTHTPRHLGLTLAGVAAQDRPPDTITVSCDTVDPDIRTVIQESVNRFQLTICYVRRPRQREGRLAQVRNNAVRALREHDHSDGRLLFIDGDVFLTPRVIAGHLHFGEQAEIVIANRIDLTEEQTQPLTVDVLTENPNQIQPSPEQVQILKELDQNARMHHRLRQMWWLGLRLFTKSHKPKILGGHFSVAFDAWVRVNGNDEEYVGWGSEDDDFARRVYATGGTSTPAIRELRAYHLYHPTRAPGRWNEHPNVERFHRRDLPLVCVHGLDNPISQHEVHVDILSP